MLADPVHHHSRPAARGPSAARVRSAALALDLALAASACNNTRVARIGPASVTDLSGRWNDADSRLVAPALVGQAPGVIVGRFGNRAAEHSPVGTFVRDVERGELRAERADRQRFAAAGTRARLASDTGARHVLQGAVPAVEDAEGRERVVHYQVDAALVDLESNARVRAGRHRIEKHVDRRRFGW